MAKKLRTTEEPEIPSDDDWHVLTPNQIVAYNLAQARAWREWTQEEAAKHLAPYLGTQWSKASFSAAERSVDGERVRNFSADEIVAFARGFGLPIGFFFLPPSRNAADVDIRLADARDPTRGAPLAELIDAVFGTDIDASYMTERVEEFFRQESVDLQTESQQRITRHTEVVLDAIVESELTRFDWWRRMLMTLADQLEDWQRRARTTMTGKDDSVHG